MAGETYVTLIGNITADPELRFTPSGAAVASFTVASSTRTYDRESNSFRDTDTMFMRCSVWNSMAENVADSLSRGMRVIIRGRLLQRSYETREGERRQTVEVRVEEIGPSLRYATAQITRSNTSGGSGFGNSDGGFGGAPSMGHAANDDPWGDTPGSSAFGEAPPF